MPVVFYTSRNAASRNIADEFFSLCPKGVEIIDTKAESVLELPDIESDYAVVLSPHRSRTAGKMITAHFPGNWGTAEMGGKDRTLNIAYASRIKEFIKSAARLAEGSGWPVCMEADHHGPTPVKPIIFVEIGSSENEWASREAAGIVAKATADMLKSTATYESVFGVGGGHYAKEFTQLMLKSGLAVGHILPKYSIDGIDYGLFLQAIKKSVEKTSSVVLLKEQTNLSQKEKIREFCARAGVAYSEI